jgi:NADH dehydrogenase [ubiquinone] 1 alpha subcomplex assembly factor 1
VTGPAGPLLLDFAAAGEAARWTAVNDGVMGGLSAGRVSAAADTGHLVFEGAVSLENGGGFASIRAKLGPVDLSGSAGLEIHARGDGRRYRLRLRDDDAWDGIAWQAGFDTRAGEWGVVRISFISLAPSFRGRLVADAPPLRLSAVRQVGFMIADRQEGSFRLELAWLRGYSGAVRR